MYRPPTTTDQLINSSLAPSNAATIVFSKTLKECLNVKITKIDLKLAVSDTFSLILPISLGQNNNG